MCRQLYVLRASHALVQAAVGVGTVIIVYIGVAFSKGGGGYDAGCQFVTATDPRAVALLRAWQAAGAVREWEGAAFGSLGPDGAFEAVPPEAIPPVFCGARGWGRVVEHLAAEVGPVAVVHTIARRLVQGMVHEFFGSPTGPLLRGEGGGVRATPSPGPWLGAGASPACQSAR